MPTWFDIFILSVVEGITEFLPVSSTGHMIIVRDLLMLPESEALSAFLVVVQAGAILAVLSVFAKLFLNWFYAWIGAVKVTAERDAFRRQSISVAASVLPFAIVGFIFKTQIKALFSPIVVAYALLVGGVLIIVTERFLKNVEAKKTINDLTIKDGLLIGLGQCLALWPGFSRSAATIISARALGYARPDAAEVSFVIGMPALLGTALYETLKEWQHLSGIWLAYLAVGIVVSWAVAYVCVKGFVGFLQKFSLSTFAYYRILLALLLLWYFKN